MFPLLLLAASLSTEVNTIAREAQGRVGAAAVVLNGSASREVLAFHAAEHFPMQSVYKFPIGMAVLHAVDQGTLKLDQLIRVEKPDLVPKALHSPIRDEHPEGVEMTLRELLRYAVSESDGTASDVLLRVLGGPPKAQAYLQGLGLTEIVIATTEMEMAHDDQAQYRNWATPRDIIALLRALYQGPALSPASREFLMQLMTRTTTGPNRLKGLLMPGTVVAHKTGSSGTSNGMTAATNDVGLISLPDANVMAIAVFVSDSPADTAIREGVIAKIARAAMGEWPKHHGRALR